MRDYYGELARGTGRAEALRRAKLHLLHQHHHHLRGLCHRHHLHRS